MYIDLVLQETSWETILVSDHWILVLVRGDRLREVPLYLLIKIKWLKKKIFSDILLQFIPFFKYI